MRLTAITAICAGLTFVAGVGVALAACESAGKVLLQDDFNTLAKSWGRNANYHVAKGELLITPPAGYNTATVNLAKLPADLDICVDVNFKPPTQGEACGGIVFWAIDYDNYDSFWVSKEGKGSVWLRQGGRWVSQVDWFPLPSGNASDGAATELRVTTRGNRARLFANGQFYTEVIGYPAKNARKVGLLGCSPAKSKGIMAFDNLIVTPAAPEPAADTPVKSGAQ